MPSPSRTMEMIASSNAGRARKRQKVDAAAKAARIAAYNARNSVLAAKRQQFGTNIAAAELAAKAQQEAQKVAERANEAAKAQQFVEAVLSGPHGSKARKWIGKGLSGNPTRVAMILRNWVATQGWRVD